VGGRVKGKGRGKEVEEEGKGGGEGKMVGGVVLLFNPGRFFGVVTGAGGSLRAYLGHVTCNIP